MHVTSLANVQRCRLHHVWPWVTTSKVQSSWQKSLSYLWDLPLTHNFPRCQEVLNILSPVSEKSPVSVNRSAAGAGLGEPRTPQRWHSPQQGRGADGFLQGVTAARRREKGRRRPVGNKSLVGENLRGKALLLTQGFTAFPPLNPPPH